ncbi:M56 family metallopeptidase [Streptomyces sp. TG1A-8]|uniref:M56 family metallopeptidase n=1 Tax=Streptomyces sp. TG1A-8 TaxID=3051385 RepID=UPI00265C5CFA|nr:M56 family metallopeptidase [Streptomyces sp. TG1A-8]MDO0930008.1 M56 family metallopeptidase [Streptomyces sp. TG1A-8]
MRISVYIPFLLTVVLAAFAPRSARRLPPCPAAWALACVALVTVVGWLGSLALLAFTGLAQMPEVAEEGRWSVSALRAADPVHLVIAVGSALALLIASVALAAAAVRQARHVRWARRECARLPGDTELVVLDDDSPLAFALPGAPGRIVVSRGMLRCLADGEREALLAHERAHLRCGHHVFQTVWRLAAAANPLLRPLATAGDFVLKRWADEVAARAGDRTVAARAVARAALASTAHSSRGAALAATGGAVPQRVRALLAPPPRLRVLPFVVGGMLLGLCCASLANAASDSEAMVDSAQYATYAASAHRPAPGHRSGVRGDGADADERRDRMQHGQQSPVPHTGQTHEGAAVGQD